MLGRAIRESGRIYSGEIVHMCWTGGKVDERKIVSIP